MNESPPESQKVKVACSNCGGQPRDHQVLREFSDDWHDRENEEMGGQTYQICKCQDCSHVCFRQETWSTYDRDNESGECEKTISVYPGVEAAESARVESHPWLEQRDADRQFMELAVEEAAKSRGEPGKVSPRVAAVIARGRDFIASAYRGENSIGEHAEYIALEGKCESLALAGATVYTTLEPCTNRNDPKVPCAERLIRRKVARVVIGMLDPNEVIRGRGILTLRKANIQVDLFPPDLMNRLEELNRDFIKLHERAAPGIVTKSDGQSQKSETQKSQDFQLTLDYEQASISSEIHHYKLVTILVNKTKKRIDDWQIEIEFPTDLLEPHVAIGMRVPERSTPKRSLFRTSMKIPLHPGDQRRVEIGYRVDDAIYGHRQDLFQEIAKARALVNGEIVAEAEKPIRDLQCF